MNTSQMLRHTMNRDSGIRKVDFVLMLGGIAYGLWTENMREQSLEGKLLYLQVCLTIWLAYYTIRMLIVGSWRQRKFNRVWDAEKAARDHAYLEGDTLHYTKHQNTMRRMFSDFYGEGL